MGAAVTLVGFPSRPLLDPTGDVRAALEVRLELGLAPFDEHAEASRRRLSNEPRCECGHHASSHYDHANHGACPCPGYMPVPRGRCTCGHRDSSHRGACLTMHCPCSSYDSQEDRP